MTEVVRLVDKAVDEQSADVERILGGFLDLCQREGASAVAVVLVKRDGTIVRNSSCASRLQLIGMLEMAKLEAALDD